MVATTNVMPTKLPKVSVYIEPELKRELEILATVERRSVSQMALYLIEQGIKQAKEQGKIPTENS